MIRAIIAVDKNRGMADDNGIPWNIPGDQKYFVDHLQSGTILMGYNTYDELSEPFGSTDNFVATSSTEQLRPGFIAISDAREFLEGATNGEVWNIGGADLLNSTLDLIDELYVTLVEGDYQTTKFIDDYSKIFTKVSESLPITENSTRYRYQIWHKNPT